jgi:hypothetical protein
MGSVAMREPTTRTSCSGDADATSQPGPASIPPYVAPGSPATAAARTRASPRKRAARCPTTFAWYTSPAAIEATRALLLRADIAPIQLEREIEGFAMNRLQGALLREAYCLVRDGIISPADIDTLVRDGLGRRWSLIGPFTTSELNTRGGLRRHGELIGPVYARIGVERAAENPWTPETIDRVATEIEQQLPHETWQENVRERDRAMIRMSSLLRRFQNPLVRRLTR